MPHLVQSLEIYSLDGPLRLARDGETSHGGVDARIARNPTQLAVYAPHDLVRW
jgi:hypothetical protein